MMNGSLGRLFCWAWASTRPEDESRAAPSAPLVKKVLLCMLVGSCWFPALLWLAKAWLIIESVLSFGTFNFIVFIVFSLFSFLSFDRMRASSARLLLDSNPTSSDFCVQQK